VVTLLVHLFNDAQIMLQRAANGDNEGAGRHQTHNCPRWLPGQRAYTFFDRRQRRQQARHRKQATKQNNLGLDTTRGTYA